MSDCCGGHSNKSHGKDAHESHHSHHEHTKMHDDGKTKDPVCGMTVDPKNVKGGSSVYQGQTYFFCNPKCKTKFDADPQAYLAPKPVTKNLKDVEFTCPMHPEIRQMGPGNCPICGMALEPVTLSADHPEDNHEYLDMRKRFIVGAILSVPLLFLTMGGRHLIHAQNAESFLPWVEFVLASPVILWGGWPFYVRFWQSLKAKTLNMFTLIHLRSPSLERGYNHQNPIRIETAEAAARIDERIHEVWKDHPHYIVIESTSDFAEKIQTATGHIKSLVPDCCKEHLESLKN